MGKLLLGALLVFLWISFGPEKWSDFKPTTGRSGVVVDVATSTGVAVRYVIDGDTVVLADEERVRFLGIDTPEEGECYYQEATAYTREMLAGRMVRFEADETDRDQYGRLLRHVFIPIATTTPEVHLNLRLVQEGYAEVLPIPPDQHYRDELAAAEITAKTEKKGRWGVCKE